MSGRGLSAGRWKILFSVGCGNKGNFAPQWWKFAATEKKAKVIVLHRHTHLTAINARLGKGASISGTVRAGRKSGPVLPGACIEADALAGEQYAHARSGRGGKYLITGFTPGRYKVEFTGGCGASYHTQWFDGVASRGKATPVAVSSGSVTSGIDAR